jgi:hypothetical protein
MFHSYYLRESQKRGAKNEFSPATFHRILPCMFRSYYLRESQKRGAKNEKALGEMDGKTTLGQIRLSMSMDNLCKKKIP